MGNRLTLTIIFSLFVTITYSTLAVASTAEDAAYDERNNFVVDRNDNCVRTKWMGNEDPCAPSRPEPIVEKKATAPSPAPLQPKFLTNKEERTIYFDFDSAELDDEAEAKLDILASIINNSRRIFNLRMVGFTDQFGSDDYNLKLSQERTETVRNYLLPKLQRSIISDQPEFRAAGKANDSRCQEVPNRARRIACMRTERRVEIELNREYRAE